LVIFPSLFQNQLFITVYRFENHHYNSKKNTDNHVTYRIKKNLLPLCKEAYDMLNTCRSMFLITSSLDVIFIP
jgi:hypothetical protein